MKMLHTKLLGKTKNRVLKMKLHKNCGFVWKPGSMCSDSMPGRRWDPFLHQPHGGWLATCLEYNRQDLNFLPFAGLAHLHARPQNGLLFLPFHRIAAVWALGANCKVQGCLWVQHKALLSACSRGKMHFLSHFIGQLSLWGAASKISSLETALQPRKDSIPPPTRHGDC